MLEVPKNIIDGVAFINALMGISLTDEQRDVVYHFNKSMSVFANPGTGKTTTAVVGLIAAQTLHGISGKKINAMSFTKLATAELSARYKAACKKCNIVANVNFNTFHSICYKIIRKQFPDFSIRNITNLERELKDFSEFMKEEGVIKWNNMYLVKDVYNAINSLNSELLFSKNSVLNSSKYGKVRKDITLEQIQKVRARWFKRNFITQSITQGDIPLMVLFILLIKPELVDSLKKEFELMIVDEFQDMSVLYLEVLSLISENLIVIGDLKQQIYGFNGSSLLILDAYKEMYPNSEEFELTQSFRCKNEIVDLANKVIANNEIKGYEKFKGVGDGGSVNVVSSDKFELDKVMDIIKNKQINKEYIDVMFLSRNNSSVIPIIEALYKNGIMFRTTKFNKVMDIPIYKDLCMMADIAVNSKDEFYVKKIKNFMPEFKGIPDDENPILEVMKVSPRESDKDLLTMNYAFSEDSSYEIINALRNFKDRCNIDDFYLASRPLFEIYSKYIIKEEWWKLERDVSYYDDLVSSIVKNKIYSVMVNEEYDKQNKNSYYLSLGEGVRCYTFHSSKGLEAQEVFLLDVDFGVCPKEENLVELVNNNYSIEAAREIRNERNLLYVAITRCKKNLVITYNNELSYLISNPNFEGYIMLDDYWKEHAKLSNETKAFKILMGCR